MTKARELPINHILKNRMACLDNCNAFQKIFGIRLVNYWEGNILGFDILKFDKFIQPEENESLNSAISRKYGQKGLQVIENLLLKND